MMILTFVHRMPFFDSSCAWRRLDPPPQRKEPWRSWNAIIMPSEHTKVSLFFENPFSASFTLNFSLPHFISLDLVHSKCSLSRFFFLYSQTRSFIRICLALLSLARPFAALKPPFLFESGHKARLCLCDAECLDIILLFWVQTKKGACTSVWGGNSMGDDCFWSDQTKIRGFFRIIINLLF